MARISDGQIADWLDQMADGLSSGLDAGAAVALAKPLPGGASQALAASLRSGGGWAGVWSEPRLALSYAEQAILSAAGTSGRLPDAMKRLADGRRQARSFKRKLLLSLAYPLFLLHFAAVAFSVSDWVEEGAAAFAVSAGKLILPVWVLCLLVWASVVFRPGAFLALARAVPLFSGYRLYWESALLGEVLASCFAAGMGVEASWKMAAAASGNPKHLALADSVETAVRSGERASVGIDDKRGGVPEGFRELYRSGEISGKLDENLEAAATRYRAEASSKLMMASLLYPKVILFGIFGYIGYKIIQAASDYFNRLSEITM